MRGRPRHLQKRGRVHEDQRGGSDSHFFRLHEMKKIGLAQNMAQQQFNIERKGKSDEFQNDLKCEVGR